LQLGLVWLAGRVSQRIVQKRGAGRVDGPRNIERTAHAQRGNAGGLDLAGDQSHGLMADRSDRHQEEGIDTVRQETLGEPRR